MRASRNFWETRHVELEVDRDEHVYGGIRDKELLALWLGMGSCG